MDEETGLYYYGARYYNPRESIFLSVDQMVEMTGTPYQYCYQNPVIYTDPTGMMPEGDPERASTGTNDTHYDSDTGTTYYGNNNGDWGYSTSDGGVGILANPEKRRNTNSSSRATTPDGKIYGGDGSGSFSDWTSRILYSFNRYNPVANVWDGVSGWITGADRYKNPISKEESIVNMMMSVPLARVVGTVEQGVAQGVKAGSIIWTSTKKLSSVENAFGHWKKHGTEFFPKYLNAKQYVEGAKDFMHNSPTGTLMKIRANGDILKYHPETNTFGVMDASGVPRTIFKPSEGLDYWLKQ